MNKNKIIRIGTRDSELALWQTRWVAQRLRNAFPDHEFSEHSLKTLGDRILNQPLNKIGDKGLFTKELDNGLLRGEIDLAVHSLKDIPTELPPGLTIGAISERWDPRDVLMSKSGAGLKDLPRGAVIATGSLRRTAQLRHFRPDFQIVDLRGNLNTRFRKYEEADWDGMVLAAAGVERLGWGNRIAERIDSEIMLPAVGQGSFGIMCREDDRHILEKIARINHRPSQLATIAERALLRTLEGGCHVPIGALGIAGNEELTLSACICSLDGRRYFRDRIEVKLSEGREADVSERAGVRLAHRLLALGGREVLDEMHLTTKG